MQLEVTLYGGARVVLGQATMTLAFDAPVVTLAQALEKLVSDHPRIHSYLLDGSGKLQSNIRVLINEKQPDMDDILTTPLHADDRLVLLAAVAGG